MAKSSPMDFSGFEKISATDKKTTLKHKGGHFMVLAHSALKPEHRKALEALPFAKGGKVKGVHRSRDEVDEVDYGRPGESVAGSEMRTEYAPRSSDPQDKKQNQKTLSKVKDEHYKVLGEMTAMKNKDRRNLADGGKIRVREEDVTTGGKSTIGPPKPADYGIQVREEDVHETPPDSGLHAETQNFAEGSLEPIQLRPDEMPEELPGDPGMPPEPQQQEPAADMAPQGPMASQGPTRQIDNIPGQAYTGPSSGPPPGEEEPTPEQIQEEQPQMSVADRILQKRNATAQDMMEGQIHPKTYNDLYESKDTPGKLGTLFGMILGGAGSGLTGQPNALLQMMDKTIERDLEAQKQSASNRQNFYKIAQNEVMQEATIKQIEETTGLTHEQAEAKFLENQKNGLTLNAMRKEFGLPPLKLSPAQEAEVHTTAKHTMELAQLHDHHLKTQNLPPNNPMRATGDATVNAMAQKKLLQDHPADAQRVQQAYDAEAKNPSLLDKFKDTPLYRHGLSSLFTKYPDSRGGSSNPPASGTPAQVQPPAAPEATPEEIEASKQKNRLLAPHASNIMNHMSQAVKLEGLSGQAGLADPDYKDVKNAYEKVSGADQALDEATDSYNHLKKLSSKTQAILSGATPGSLAGVLAAAGGATGLALSRTPAGGEIGAATGAGMGAVLGKLKEALGPDEYREYMATLAELDTNISNAMPGLPPTARLGIIHDVLPFYSDGPKTDAAKRHALVAKVHSGVREETALLRRKGMAK